LITTIDHLGPVTTAAQARSQDCKFGGSFSVWGADIFRVLLYCYSLLAMSTVSVTEYRPTNVVVGLIK